MEKISQEGREERTRLKICPEERDAWTRFVKKVVTNEQN